jgi:uncharacterized protein DUF4331
MRRAWFIGIGVLVAGWLLQPAWAADHADGPAAKADPSADITDVFAWMSPDASRLILIMDLVRNASTASRFSDSVDYVFHTTSAVSFGAPASPEVAVVCRFNKKQRIHCSAPHGEHVDGDASGLNGLTSKKGKLRVFAGLRDDPFFFNLDGFKATAAIVAGAAGGLTFDAAGCPALDAGTSAALVNQLQTAPGGGPAVDNFARFNVLAIVVSIDKSVVTKNGPIVGVWGSTNRRDGKDDEAKDGDGEDADACDHKGPGREPGHDHGHGHPCHPPHLGRAQIDRMGRAGVNTALTDPFDLDEERHGMIQDEYNGATDPAQWASMFSGEIAGNLAILDSLDTVCGNQLLAGPSAVAGRYNTLAGILADDELYVNTASGTCNQYLAVEANAVGITNNDCGGRTPLEDTIDTTYSLLAIGALSGVTDGIAADADGTASLTTFPYLDQPN